jgi:anaerobic magnesium-protoporphyrin IX monomethyl ester cyclase
MKIGCVYTVETYSSIEQPFSTPTEIPFGISFILTILQEAGHEVELFVVTPDTPLDEYIGRYIKEEKPSLFCMTAVSTQYWQAKKVAQYISKVDEGVFCVLGGHHASLNSEEVINDGIFDAICIGEGEQAVLDLVDALSNNGDLNCITSLWIRDRNTGKVYKNPTGEFRGDLDNLPFMNRKIWDKWIVRPDEYPAILLGRGCPFKCTYCSNHAMEVLSEGDYVRFRSPEHIVGEIKYIVQEYPEVERIYLEVETFGANRKASYAVFDAIAEYNQTRKNPIRFGVNMALTSNYMMNPERRIELFEKVRAANLTRINIGLETGSERLRKIIKRPQYTNAELVDFCSMAREYGIDVVFFVLIGLPGETIEDYYETIKVARASQPYLCSVSIFFPYLGTDLADTAINMGLIDKDNLSPTGERTKSVLCMDQFSAKRIRFEYIIFSWRVYRGHWPFLKVVAHVIADFLRAHPRWYGFYLSVRNNTDFVMALANKYGGGRHKVRKLAKTVGTRVDIMN